MDMTVAERIKSEINNKDVVLFMKGSKVFPQCGFSAQVVQILGMLGVTYKDVDILADTALRQGIKDFSNWPTIPQLYINGQLIGGSDILQQLYENGELHKLLSKAKS